MEPKRIWKRCEITYCYCNASRIKPHVHCPCIFCNYDAVSVRTEHRHWESWKSASTTESSFSDNNMDFASTNHSNEEVMDDNANESSDDDHTNDLIFSTIDDNSNQSSSFTLNFNNEQDLSSLSAASQQDNDKEASDHIDEGEQEFERRYI